VRESLELLIRSEGWQPETIRVSTGIPCHTHERSFQAASARRRFSSGLNGLELQKRVAVERTDMPIIFIHWLW